MKNGYKAPVYASLALAFASLGDAFLYPFLPVNAELVGVPVMWIGVILSINRFIRIFSNTWMVHLFARHGSRLVMVIAVALAIASTAAYALASSIFLWLSLRVVWGLSFSAMRIGTLGYALQHKRQGFSLGLSKGIQETGPMIALCLVPLLLFYFETAATFFVLAVCSLPALYFSWKLPENTNSVTPIGGKIFHRIPSVVNSITFAAAFIIDGVIVVILGVLFLHHKGELSLLTATALAAIYLAYRRICLVIFSPTGGWIADIVGLGKLFNFSLLAMIVGLFVLLAGWVDLGAIILFTFYSVHSAITPGKVSEQQPNALMAAAENATWRDIGAAFGTLAGGLLLTSDYTITMLMIATFFLTVLFFVHGWKSTTIKLSYIWK